MALTSAVGRGQAHLVLASLVDRRQPVATTLRDPLADGAVDHPRLAEAASLRATPRDLDARAIEDGFGSTDGPALGEGETIQSRQDPSSHREGRRARTGRLHDDPTGGGVRGHLVPGRDVDALDLGERGEPLRARQPVPPRSRPGERELGRRLLAVADEEGVDERRQRLRVGSHGAARNHQRCPLVARRRSQRDTAEVEHQEQRW
jgi:hypothetical protein